jgi:translocator assembly and maintenance protein 41
MADDPFLDDLIGTFPPVHAAFAYGSAVFKQHGYSDAQQRSAMTDMVFVVADAEAWHRENLIRHPAHYSALGWLGASAVADIQNSGGGIYYNQSVVRGRPVKYGVISHGAFHDDLVSWSGLYVSGRLHKPVRALRVTPPDIVALLEENRRSALRAALLLLPDRFDGDRLFGTICGLSYSGDVRMGVGESHHKPSDIATGQRESLTQLYAGPIAEAREWLVPTAPAVSGGESIAAHFVQDVSRPARSELVARLPSCTQRMLLEALDERASKEGAPSTALADATRCLWQRSGNEAEANRRLASALGRALSLTVRRSSFAQTLKGIATAGVATSVSYALTKMRKRTLQDERTTWAVHTGGGGTGTT